MQFTSREGVGCLVNIYESGWGSQADYTKTGTDVPFAVESGVKELIGGASPFEWQDDSSTDLLEQVRYRTGYIRAIETAEGELDDLIPAYTTDHYVEAFYGTERVFTGYMKCEEYSVGFVAAPYEREFPVVSPLGLLNDMYFDIPSVPQYFTMGALLKEILDGINPYTQNANNSERAGYTTVYYPGDNYYPWNCTMSSILVVPFNSNFDRHDLVTVAEQKLYAPKTYGYWMENLCACMGFMVHDAPDGPVFVDMGMKDGGVYTSIPVQNLPAANTGRGISNNPIVSLTNYFVPSDDNALQSVVRPLNKLYMRYAGSRLLEQKLSLDRCVFASTGGVYGTGPVYEYVLKAQPVGPEMSFSEGVLLTNPTFTGAGEMSDKGAAAFAYGVFNNNNDKSVGIDEAWTIKYNSSWDRDTKILGAAFYEQPVFPYGKLLLKIIFEKGNSLLDMKSTNFTPFYLFLVIKRGGMYWSISDNSWGTGFARNKILIQGDGKVRSNASLRESQVAIRTDVDGLLLNYGENSIGALEISFYAHPTQGEGAELLDGQYIRIKELSINSPYQGDPYFPEYKESVLISSTSRGMGEKSIDLDFNNDVNHRGTNSFSTPAGVTPRDVSYSYMTSPQYILQERMRKSRARAQHDIYRSVWRYYKDGWRWKTLGYDGDMKMDLWTLHIVRSQRWENS